MKLLMVSFVNGPICKQFVELSCLVGLHLLVMFLDTLLLRFDNIVVNFNAKRLISDFLVSRIHAMYSPLGDNV